MSVHTGTGLSAGPTAGLKRQVPAASAALGRMDPGSGVAGLYIAPDVARTVTHIIDRDGVLRETLIAGQSYESFEHTIKPYL